MADLTLADFLQGRRNPLMEATLGGDDVGRRPNALMTYGKGSVQSIPTQEALGQHNLLSRFAGSFGQPSLDLTRSITHEMERGRTPEPGFWGQVEAATAAFPFGPPMGPFGTVRPGLDMSQAARLARAREMGFNTDETLYHGTRSAFDAFDPAMIGSRIGAGEGGFFLTPSNRLASYFASELGFATPGQHHGSVLPLYIRPGRQMTIGPAEMPQYSRLAGQNEPYIMYGSDPFSEAIGRARAGGHDSVRFRRVNDEGIIADQVVVFNPSDIRSVNAAFDPARRNSSNLMYGIAAPVAGTGVAATLNDRPQ